MEKHSSGIEEHNLSLKPLNTSCIALIQAHPIKGQLMGNAFLPKTSAKQFVTGLYRIAFLRQGAIVRCPEKTHQAKG